MRTLLDNYPVLYFMILYAQPEVVYRQFLHHMHHKFNSQTVKLKCEAGLKKVSFAALHSFS
jgi:hypothetical protein